MRIVGTLDSRTGLATMAAMESPMSKMYCYSLNVDGEERANQSSKAWSRDEAVEIGRAMLALVVLTEQPKVAYCSVFMDLGTDDEPLGAWDYDTAHPEMVWTPEE